jgi:hypothetical protein
VTARKAQAPSTLAAALQVAELQSHGARLREIVAMEAQLALLEQFREQLKANDFDLYAPYRSREIDWDTSRKALRISSCGFGFSVKRLHTTLIGLGFKETTRDLYGSFASVVLTKGRLRISFHVNTSGEAAVPAPVQASAPAELITEGGAA